MNINVLPIFYNKIKNTVQEYSLKDQLLSSSCASFLTFLDEIEDIVCDHDLKITRMSIIFEGFYRIIPEGSILKLQLMKIRLWRWENHYGVPTLGFLMSFHIEIENTCATLNDLLIDKPWLISRSHFDSFDQNNYILWNTQSLIDSGNTTESLDQFLKTNNPSGGFTIGPCDIISQKFIEYSAIKNVVLEIGAAFGMTSLQALIKCPTVFCNDIHPHNLVVTWNRYRAYKKLKKDADGNNLILLPGKFPEELINLPHQFFDAILICRVLHFFSGAQIEKSLKQLFSYLKPGGKLFIVCETPYLKNWQTFIPEYERRVSENQKWPGEIKNSSYYETSGRSALLPNFVHWITKEVLERSLRDAKFNIDYLEYMDRRNQFPDDLLLDGRESIGAIAVKV